MADAPAPIITLLSDFGLSDGYVAAIKGTLLGLCPRVNLVDVSHLIAPQAISSCAYVLASCYHDFPAGTVHLAVVDPGVGGARKALALRAGAHWFVGPDNGLFALVLAREPDWEARELSHAELHRRPLSATFHGRDLFAPAAAWLACGRAFEELGERVEPEQPDWRQAVPSAEGLRGRIIHFDHFGNAVTNISVDMLPTEAPFDALRVNVGRHRLRFRRTYSEVAEGRSLALIGSSGLVELSTSGGSARRVLQLQWLAEVTITFQAQACQPGLPGEDNSDTP